MRTKNKKSTNSNRPRLKIGIALGAPAVIAAIVVGIFLVLSGTFSQSIEAGLFAQVGGQSVELNQNCTISILNRTANVQEDGSWFIPNVPANLGLVRARATCVRDGVTLSGQSEFFNVVPGIVNGFDAEIILGVVDPRPESIEVTAPTAAMTSPGQQVQLTVTATLPDGSTQDVTGASAGTSYTSSSAAIISVDENGLVAGRASGTALISATNEGNIAILTMRVVLSGDSDGDGIPDDVELVNGLDPNNSVDALEDFDFDGLTNKEELIDLGTDFQNPDTDGDGIEDGEEVVPGDDGFVTNPLISDID